MGGLDAEVGVVSSMLYVKYMEIYGSYHRKTLFSFLRIINLLFAQKIYGEVSIGREEVSNMYTSL